MSDPSKRWSIKLPFLPEAEITDLTYYVGIGILVAVELIELPIAAVLVGSKLLADNKHSRVLAEIGSGLGEAVLE